MTPQNVDESLLPASSAPEPPPGHVKAVLFCPGCGHEGHATADWETRDDYVAGTRAVVCPECATTVTERPLPKRSLNSASGPGRWEATGRRLPWDTWRDLWRSSVDLVTTWPRPGPCRTDP
jgi:hypothetical protein